MQISDDETWGWGWLWSVYFSYLLVYYPIYSFATYSSTHFGLASVRGYNNVTVGVTGDWLIAELSHSCSHGRSALVRGVVARH